MLACVVILSLCADLVAQGQVVECYKIDVDSVEITLRVMGILDERTVWSSVLREKSAAAYKLYEQGFFPSLRYLLREDNKDWVAVHVFMQSDADTIVLWNADWFFWYGDSAIVSEDYLTERNFQELITRGDILRLPSPGLTRGKKSGAIWFFIGFPKNSFERLKRNGDCYLFKPPDSVTVVNRWR